MKQSSKLEDIFYIIMLIAALVLGVYNIVTINQTNKECTKEVDAQILSFTSEGRKTYAMLDVEGTKLRYEYVKGDIGDYVTIRTNEEITKVVSDWKVNEQMILGILMIIISVPLMIVELRIKIMDL